jgi:hypothetical protein
MQFIYRVVFKTVDRPPLLCLHTGFVGSPFFDLNDTKDFRRTTRRR